MNHKSDRIKRERPACAECGGYAIVNGLCGFCYKERERKRVVAAMPQRERTGFACGVDAVRRELER